MGGNGKIMQLKSKIFQKFSFVLGYKVDKFVKLLQIPRIWITNFI